MTEGKGVHRTGKGMDWPATLVSTSLGSERRPLLYIIKVSLEDPLFGLQLGGHQRVKQ